MPGMPKPGDLVADKYRIEKLIGAGGMGCVLAAEHTLLRTRVAIKLLLPDAAVLPGATERFLREAQAAGALRGEHVTRVLDMGVSESGAPFLVMEYLSGHDLRRVIRERAPLPIQEAVGFVLQTCEAILEAHAVGILHRDIKPANIFVTSRPNGTVLVKVLDFGLAKVLSPLDRDAPEDNVTQTGQVIGSPQYMPPEQFRSLRNADVRSDIWALGVVFYELVTGKRPFTGEGMLGIMASVVADAPEPPRALRPDLPPALDALIMRCLEKRAERRPQRVADLIALLEPFASRPERASSAWIDLPALEESEPTTLPVRQRSSPEAPSPVDMPASIAVPVHPSNPIEPEPPPQSLISSVGESISSSEATVSVAMEEVTDLSQASTMPRRPLRSPISRFMWAVLGGSLVLVIGGGAGVRWLVSNSFDKPSGERGAASEMNIVSTVQHPLAPAATLPPETHAEGGGPLPAVPQAPPGDAPVPTAGHGPSPVPAPRTSGSALSPSPRASARTIAPTSPSATAAPPSVEAPPPSEKEPDAAPPRKPNGDSNDPFGSKYN